MSVPFSPRRLSALIVNHNSGAWTQRCVESLQRAWGTEGRDPGDLEIIVLDSGSSLAEATWWQSLRRTGVRVRNSPANVGYATGLNMAFELSTGGPRDAVALLNPDLYFLPGSIGPLLERLEEDDAVGAVAPRIYLDEERQILLPPNHLPSPWGELAEVLAEHFPRFARRRAARWTEWARRAWQTQEVRTQEMLSGACMFLRRETILHMGAPMDPGYPLYFEDADLCVRLARAGYLLELQPAAEVLHHWSRCAGPTFEGEVARRHAHGRALYMTTHHGGAAATFLRFATDRLRARLARRPALAMQPLVDLGGLTESPVLEFERDGQYLLELSLTPYWGLSAGTTVEGSTYRYPARTWSWLFPGTYYLRAVDLSTGQALGAWTFTKESAARSWPLDSIPGGALGSLRRALPRRGERVG